MANGQLNGRVALITGGGRGLGRAIALGYAAEGAHVAVCSRTADEVEETARLVRAKGGEALGVAADLTRADGATRLVEAVEEAFGQLDILFLNAGGDAGAREPIESVDADAWMKTVEINLYTAFHVAKGAIPLLKKSDNGKILTMGSGLGRRPDKRSSAYSASKAGLWALTQSLALELAPYGITANELIPGPVRTKGPDLEDFEPYVIGEGDWENEWMKRAEDVVPLAVFLASQHKHGPSGQSFALNRRLL